MRQTGLLAVFCMLLAASSATAQNLSSSAEVHSTRDIANATRGAVELRRMAACIFRSDHARAVLLLTSKPGSDNEANIGSAMVSRMSGCISMGIPWLSWSWRELRGSLAEFAYLSLPAGMTSGESMEIDSVPLPVAWLKDKPTEAEARLLVAHEFAACVVVAAPKEVAQIPGTIPRSAEEHGLLRQILPSLGPCLGKGATMSLDAASLRSLLSQELYRVTLARREGGTGLQTSSVESASARPKL